jgi:hypothetical protein
MDDFEGLWFDCEKVNSNTTIEQVMIFNLIYKLEIMLKILKVFVRKTMCNFS